jgi:hypothetical protein
VCACVRDGASAHRLLRSATGKGRPCTSRTKPPCAVPWRGGTRAPVHAQPGPPKTPRKEWCSPPCVTTAVRGVQPAVGLPAAGRSEGSDGGGGGATKGATCHGACPLMAGGMSARVVVTGAVRTHLRRWRGRRRGRRLVPLDGKAGRRRAAHVGEGDGRDEAQVGALDVPRHARGAGLRLHAGRAQRHL